MPLRIGPIEAGREQNIGDANVLAEQIPRSLDSRRHRLEIMEKISLGECDGRRRLAIDRRQPFEPAYPVERAGVEFGHDEVAPLIQLGPTLRISRQVQPVRIAKVSLRY